MLWSGESESEAAGLGYCSRLHYLLPGPIFPWSNNILEAACSAGSEEIEVLVWLAVCLQLPWDWLSLPLAVRVVVMSRWDRNGRRALKKKIGLGSPLVKEEADSRLMCLIASSPRFIACFGFQLKTNSLYSVKHHLRCCETDPPHPSLGRIVAPEG